MLHFLLSLLFAVSAFAAKPSETIINEAIQRWMQEQQIPGVAVAYFDGQDGHLYNFGVQDRSSSAPVTENTIFEIASVTKVFTSTELALQIDKGKMALNDQLIKYLPALKNANGSIAQVTLVSLATHTSSLPRVPPPQKSGYNHAKIIQFLRKWNAEFPVGSKYLYSNMGFGVLGYALANLAGTDYFDLIKADILTPLGMDSTMIKVPAAFNGRYATGYNQGNKPAARWGLNAWPAGGALRSTSSDMLKFLKANLNVQGAGPQDLLKAMQFAQQGQFKANDKLTLGLGWQRFQGEKFLFIDKNGGVPGFSSYIGMIPEKKIGIVILANRGKTQSTTIGREILSKLAK